VGLTGCNHVMELVKFKQRLVSASANANTNTNDERKFQTQTKLKIFSLWYFIMRHLGVQDHLNAVLVCTEWFMYGSNEASWIPNLTLTIKTRLEHKFSKHEFCKPTNTLCQIPQFVMGMFSRHTQAIKIGHLHQWERANAFMQLIFDNVCKNCSELKYIYMKIGTLQLNEETFKQMCLLRNLREFYWDDVDECGLKYSISDIKSLTHLERVSSKMMNLVLAPHNIQYIHHLPFSHIHISYGRKNHDMVPVNSTNPSDLIFLKRAYDTLSSLYLRNIQLLHFDFKSIANFHNITSLCLHNAYNLSHQLIRDICTSGLKLTTLRFNNFSVDDKFKEFKFEEYQEFKEYKLSEFNENPFDQLGRLTTLTHLELTECSYVNDYRIATQLPPLKQLEIIALTNTGIDNKTFAAIGTLIEMTAISIAVNRITSSGFDHFVKLPKLAYLEASIIEITPVYVENFNQTRLKNNLPKVTWT